ncbi:MAG: hypothetical protein JWP44_4697 [Mucilaginibacter sp.]|nr:hypothetical protein [Mucilaginibacter sp.]
MTNDIENKEWLNDYPSLKKVNKNNPFIVPEGYFDELGMRIMSGIKLNDFKNKMPFDGFVVPENYFEELSGNIQSRINIENALHAENTGFIVPENYFEELSSNIQSRVNIEDALNTDTPFTVPENYFEELNAGINSRIFVEEALAGADTAFDVPQDYFNRLNKNILNKTVNRDIVKRKSVVIRLFSSTAVKYATAACFAAMIGTGVLLKQVYAPVAVHNRSYLHKQLSNVPVDEIQSYLELNIDDTQHTVTTGGLSVNDAGLNDDLQNYTNNTQ